METTTTLKSQVPSSDLNCVNTQKNNSKFNSTKKSMFMNRPKSPKPQVPSTNVICVGATQKQHFQFALKQKLLLTCLAIIFSFIANAQVGINCHNAEPIFIGHNSAPFLTPNSSIQTQTSNTNYWYRFNANETSKILKVVNQIASPLATSLKVYSGTCASRVLIASASIASTSSISTSGFVDSMQVTVSGLTIGSTYFIEVSGTIAGAKNYVLSVFGTSTVPCQNALPIACVPNVLTDGCEMIYNGSFEQNSHYPSGNSTPGNCYLYNACGWFNPAEGLTPPNGIVNASEGTPDYFYPDYVPSSTSTQIETQENRPNCDFDGDVPANYTTFSWGHDPLASNNSGMYTNYQTTLGYAGIFASILNYTPATPETGATLNYYYAEYLGTTLRAPLECGVTYKMSFWVQLANNSSFSCNNLGAMFAINPTTPSYNSSLQFTTGGVSYSSTSMAADNVNSFSVLPNNISNGNTLVTTGSWKKLTFTYTAKGGEQYLYIGDFDVTNTNQHSAPGANQLSSIPGSYYIIDDVSLKPVPSALTIAGTPTANVCSNSSEVLSANGGFATASPNACPNEIKYVWNTGQVGSPITVNPSIPSSAGTASTTIGYTVTAYLADLPTCTYSTSTTISVNPTPDCPIISSSICTNQTNTITVSNAQTGVTYYWSPANGITHVPNTNGSQVIITNPHAGTVYSVTAQFTGCGIITKVTPTTTCCTCTSTFTVSPSPTVSISENPDPAVFCPSDAGSAVNLSASSSVNVYNWSPGTGLDCPTCSDPIANPSTTTNYTLTTTDPITGCSAQAYVTVTPTCSCGSPSSPAYTGPANIGLGLSAYFPNSSYSINYNISITGSGQVTLSNETFVFGPNVSLTIGSGCTIILDHCHLLACSDMWQGIIVMPGGHLIVQNNSMIEDAIEAINCSNFLQTPPNINYNSVNINGCVFNRNKTAIRINNYNYATAFPATIQNAVFTSRHLPATLTTNSWTSPATPGALKNLVAVPTLQAPYKLANTASYIFANLKSPNQNINGVYGVYLNNVGTSNTNGANSLPTTYNDITIGVAGTTPSNINLNLFDGLYYGIYGLNSNFTSINNSFELMNAYPYNPFCLKCNPNPYPSSGSAIYGINTFLTNKSYNRAQVIYPNYNPATNPNVNGINYYTPTSNNKFYDVVNAVNINNYQEVHVAGTDIRSKQTNTIPFSLFSLPGTNGVIVSSSTYKYNYLRYNLITNITNGIVFHGNSVAAGVTSLGFGGVNADYNNVTAFFNNTPTTQYVARAITLDNTINCFNPNTCITNALFSVTSNNNNIQNVYSGIEMSNWFSPVIKRLIMRIFADNNYITTVQNTIVPTSTQYGINANNCYSHSISNNNINGFGITNFNVRAVYSVDNNVSKVYCNNVNNITKGFEFEGVSSGFGTNDITTWQNNTMNTNAQGFALTNACILGQQGSPTSASDNQWAGTWTGSNFGTFVDASSNAVNSPIYVQTNSSATSSIYYPQNSSSAFSGVTDYVTLTNSALFFSATPSGNVCATPPQPPCINCRVSNLRLAEKLVQDSIPFIILPTQSTFKGQLKYYRLLSANDSLADTSIVLQNFAVVNQNTNLGAITNIENNLAQGNVSAAQAMNNAFAPTTAIESNYKNFYNAAINYALQTDSVIDSTVVYNLANSCPAVNGDVVYAARALYNVVNHTNIYFESNCPYDSLSQTPAASARRANQATGISTVSTAKTILVYPNPSSGDIFISGSDLTDKQWNVEITDVTGRIVLQNTYRVNQGLIKLSTQLTNGVYLVKVITSNGQILQQKVIISK